MAHSFMVASMPSHRRGRGLDNYADLRRGIIPQVTLGIASSGVPGCSPTFPVVLPPGAPVLASGADVPDVMLPLGGKERAPGRESEEIAANRSWLRLLAKLLCPLVPDLAWLPDGETPDYSDASWVAH